MRWLRKAHRRARVVRELARGLVSTSHPLLAHMIVTRRCNLDCTYCNEFDKTSAPVPFDVLEHRVARLAWLGTSVLTFSGGEPLLHPRLPDLITYVRRQGMIAGLITNGYLLSPPLIDSLNRAGLDYLQISIDNVEPDGVSKKSLRLLDPKLRWLRDRALFEVNINSVVGGGVGRPADVLAVGQRARDLGFSTSVGIIHDGRGHLTPLADTDRDMFGRLRRSSRGARIFSALYSGVRDFQINLVQGRPNDWRCRAGARYVYICEDGLVHWCSQQRGRPGTPLDTYSTDDLRRAFLTPKPCAPLCTLGCAHRVSMMDAWRAPQVLAPAADKRHGSAG